MSDETLFPVEPFPDRWPGPEEDLAEEEHADGWTTLYRLYDSVDTLLYVGIAGNVGRRMNDHAKAKPWWEAVTRVAVEHFPTRQEAAAAERNHMASGSVIFNVMMNGPKQVRWCQPLVIGCGTWRWTIGSSSWMMHLAKTIEFGREEHLLPAESAFFDEVWRECAKRYGGAVLRGYDPGSTARALRAE